VGFDGFDSLVFADTAVEAALSCFGRLKAEKAAGRRSLIVTLVDGDGAESIARRGLGTVARFEEIAPAAGPGNPQALRERLSMVIRQIGPRHVLAPIGLLGTSRSIDYFGLLRAAMSVHKGRDLLFFEERPHCLVAEAIMLRLSFLGARLPPASELRSPRRHLAFTLRLLVGFTPPLFGGARERFRVARAQRTAFREAADWDPHKALGPRLQPVMEPFPTEDADDIFAFAGELGCATAMGPPNSFKRRMLRHAASGGSRTPIERYWLSLPGGDEADPVGELF